MKNTIIILLAILLSVSVYFNLQKNKPTQLSIEDLFHKKQECQKYRQEIEKKLKERGRTLSDGSHLYFVLNKIFYSPKTNSCLYVATMEGGLSEAWFLEDVLSGENLIYRPLNNIADPHFAEKKKAFYDAVKGYE